MTAHMRMEKRMDNEIIEKLKRHRGYNDGRIRPYPLNETQWIADTSIPSKRARKWKVLREEKSERYRLFATPEQAAIALEDWINRFDDDGQGV